MSHHIDEETRQKIKGFLPSAITNTLESYEGFMHFEGEGSSKDFASHHSACKIAIAHLELLLKLARWADVTELEKGKNDPFKEILLQAKQRVQQQEAEEKDR